MIAGTLILENRSVTCSVISPDVTNFRAGTGKLVCLMAVPRMEGVALSVKLVPYFSGLNVVCSSCKLIFRN